MTGLNLSRSRVMLDTDFIREFAAFADDLPKVVRRAAAATSRWLRTVTMAELGYELYIDNRALRSRFRLYKNGRISKLWIGVREIGVHRTGRPVQNRRGVRVGAQFYEGAFINPMESDQLLVWRRQSKARKDIKLVTLDISDDVDSIVENYLSDINGKFRNFFNKELHNALAGKALPLAA